MADQITHHGFFGDRERAFCLTDAMVAELERLTGSGIGTLFMQIARNQFHLETLIEAIRLGLIGAGENPAAAARLCAPLRAIPSCCRSAPGSPMPFG